MAVLKQDPNQNAYCSLLKREYIPAIPHVH